MFKIKFRFNWSNEEIIETLNSEDELNTLLTLVSEIIYIQKIA